MTKTGLNISFDYLFNLKYGTLSDILNSVTTNPVKNKLIIDVAAKTEELNIEIANFDSIYNRLLSYKLILIQQDTLLLVMVHHRQYIK
jgi:hypothetical protein